MTKSEFYAQFKRLRIAYNIVESGETPFWKEKAAEYYDAVKNYPLDIFTATITEIIRTEERFPPVALILKRLTPRTAFQVTATEIPSADEIRQLEQDRERHLEYKRRVDAMEKTSATYCRLRDLAIQKLEIRPSAANNLHEAIIPYTMAYILRCEEEKGTV